MMKSNQTKFNNSAYANILPNVQQILVALFMVACCLVAWYLKPKTTWFEYIGSPNYEELIPNKFGDWVRNTEDLPRIIDPQQLYALNNIYTQIITRDYIHVPTGRHIMLSVAYGDNQTFSKQLHRSESCYSSQGFKIENLHQDKINFSSATVELNRFTGITNNKQEQVNYFIRIGDRVISGPPSQLNLARMEMGLKGYIADGLLFRVSEVNDDVKSSNKLQEQFVNDLLNTLSPVQQSLFVGTN